MEGKAKKQQKVYIAASVFALRLGKMTNDINTVNRVKSDTDGADRQLAYLYWHTSQMSDEVASKLIAIVSYQPCK